MAEYIDFENIIIDEPKLGDLIVVLRTAPGSTIETAYKSDIKFLKFLYASPDEIEKITEGVKNVYPLITEEISKYASDELIATKAMPLADADFYRSKIITYENLSALLETYLTQNDLSIIISELTKEYESHAYNLRTDLANVAVQGRAASTTVSNADTMSEAIYSIDVSSSSSSSGSSSSS